MAKKPSTRISDFLTGEDTGDIQALQDYATTPERFSFGPTAGEIWVCERMIFNLTDSGGMSPTEYAALGTFLNPGYDVRVVNGDGDVLSVLNGSKPITVNADINSVCFDFNNMGLNIAGPDTFVSRWTWSKAGSPVRLIGDNGEKIVIDFVNSFVGMNYHTFFVDGGTEGQAGS